MNDLSKVSILLTNGEDPNKLNEEGLSALHIAVLKENKNMIYLLLKNGANPNIQSTNTQQTCLHFAYQQRNSEEIVNLLIKYNADMNILDIYNKKPKEYAQSVLQSSENITNTYQENTQQKNYGQILRLTAEVSARFLFSVYTQQQVMLTHESLCRYQ